MTARVVVIGVGNELRGDDAAGLLAVRAVATLLPPGVDVRESDGETARLVEAWTDADVVIVVDAVCSGASPGTVHRVDVQDVGVPSWVGPGSTHALGLSDAIALARALDRLPRRLVVIGIEAAIVTTGGAVTQSVVDACVRAADLILEEVATCVSLHPAE